jgi:hypothetical protein
MQPSSPAAAISPFRGQASTGAEKKQVLPPPAPRGLCPAESTGDGRGGGGGEVVVTGELFPPPVSPRGGSDAGAVLKTSLDLDFFTY